MNKRTNQFTTPKPSLDPSYELSYLLGVLKGDACIYKTTNKNNDEYIIQLCARDKDFAEYFISILEKIFHRKVAIMTYKDDRKALFYKVVIRSKHFYEWYKAKSENEVFGLAEAFPNAFIKGVFDSEGNLSYYKTRYKDKIYTYSVIRIVSSDEPLINKIKELLFEFSIESKIAIRKPVETVINGRMCKFKKLIYALGIYKQEHVSKFYNIIGTSIKRKSIGG